MNKNPFVDYLNMYSPTSPMQQAMFDEFIEDLHKTEFSSIPPFQYRTRTQDYLQKLFQEGIDELGRSKAIILTGNAGDGKTYLCRQAIRAFTNTSNDTVWGDSGLLELVIVRNNRQLKLKVTKDLSELSEEVGLNVIDDLQGCLKDEWGNNFMLVAANEGRLRALVALRQYAELQEVIDKQIRSGPDVSQAIVVINLTSSTNSLLVKDLLQWATHEDRWKPCTQCSAKSACPIIKNRLSLQGETPTSRYEALIQTLEDLEIHVTVRELLIHVAYSLTGGLTCEQVLNQSRDSFKWKGLAPRHAYFNNVFGASLPANLMERSTVISSLRRLDPAAECIQEVDEFILMGQSLTQSSGPTPNNTLLEDEADPLLGFGEFLRQRNVFLEGQNSDTDAEGGIISWLKHCRRKMYFEGESDQLALRQLHFHYLDYYRNLTRHNHQSGNELDRVRNTLALGLNRFFTDVFNVTSSEIILSHQYNSGLNEAIPVVVYSVPLAHVRVFNNSTRKSELIGNNRVQLQLLMRVFDPDDFSGSSQTTIIPEELTLLKFEYLMHRTKGATPNILAEDCELELRDFKDRVIKAIPRRSSSELAILTRKGKVLRITLPSE